MQESKKIFHAERSLQSQTQLETGKISSGKWQGQTVSVDSTPDVDDTIFAARLRVALGITASPDFKPLNQRKIACEQRFNPIQPRAIKAYGDATATNVRQAKTAQQYLRHYLSGAEKPKMDLSVSSLMQHYMALQLLVNALQSGDAEFVAMMTPSESGPIGLSEWADMLKEAGDDPEKVAEALANVEGMPEGRNDLFNLMKTLRFNPDQLKRKFREAQNIPELSDTERNTAIQSIQDELRSLETSHRSTILASQISIEEQTDFSTLNFIDEIDNKSDLENQSFNFSLKKIFEKYPYAILPELLPKIIKSLGDQLRAMPNSNDKIQISVVIREMMSLRIAAYLIQLLENLSKLMFRLYETPIDKERLAHGLKDLLSGIWIAPRKFDALVNDMQIKEVAPTIVFLQRIMYILRDLPLQVFPDDPTRTAVLDAAQTATDKAVAREEYVQINSETENAAKIIEHPPRELAR